jgi:glycosyltransferase involved in cell wall biosynthesis
VRLDANLSARRARWPQAGATVTEPSVTVGLPVYNGEPYLADALRSILTQTHEDLRLVISDNASTDATEEICRAAAASDERVTYERQSENRGAAWNYNRTFALSRSPFFKWAAADDLLAPTCVARCHETLASAPHSVVMVYPRTVIVDAAANPVRDWNDGLDVRARRAHTRFNRVVRNAVLGNGIFGLVRADALARTRGHGNYPSADMVFLAELALLGEIWELPEPLFLRRMHEKTSRAANTDLEQLSAWFDPRAAPVTNEMRRLLREHLAAIHHAKLPPWEKGLTLGQFAFVWTRRHARWYAWLAAMARRQP